MTQVAYCKDRTNAKNHKGISSKKGILKKPN